MTDTKTAAEQAALIRKSVKEWNAWRGTDLSDADLRDADLSDADLRDADLRDANLRGANLSGAVKVEGLICRMYRSDDHLFLAFTTNRGVMIKAGCRLLSPADYRIHAANTYPDTKKAVETLRIIQYIEDCAKEQE